MKVLLINPPIYDFAAYSLWAKPVGLLKILSLLKNNNIETFFIDTLDISNLSYEEIKQNKIKVKKNGRHGYIKEIVEKPKQLQNITRHFFRFGIPDNKIEDFLKEIPNPDYVIITSIMTYWYLGVEEIIKILKKTFPESRIILGGIYVNLCFGHALKLGAHYTVRTIDEICKILKLPFQNHFFPLPLDCYNKNFFAPVYTSFGCPYSCIYCANKFLNKRFVFRNVDEVVKEILFYYENFNIKNFAFYDDALLLNKNEHFIPLIKKIIELNLDINFHCPNGVHISQIDEEIAELMCKGNFRDIRLSLETANETLQKKIGYKTDNSQFINAVRVLEEFGFTKENLSVYLLVGIPYQTTSDIIDSINFAKQFNVKIKLAEYSPIPHTKLWNEAVKTAKFDIENEPLYHNNKILPVSVPELTIDELNKIKKVAHS